MAEINDAAVLTRAQVLAERDGFDWKPGPKFELRRLLSEARRRLYVLNAREELRREAINA